jgi:hypothetical protein
MQIRIELYYHNKESQESEEMKEHLKKVFNVDGDFIEGAKKGEYLFDPDGRAFENKETNKFRFHMNKKTQLRDEIY